MITAVKRSAGAAWTTCPDWCTIEHHRVEIFNPTGRRMTEHTNDLGVVGEMSFIRVREDQLTPAGVESADKVLVFGTHDSYWLDAEQWAQLVALVTANADTFGAER